MDALISIAAFFLVLGVVICVHEFGHLIVAKLFGVRVLTFSFGFGKRLIGFRLGETDYRISLVPLGGYVSLSGENPSDNLESVRDFVNRPRWQRVLILFAGPAMNGILAIVIFGMIFMTLGETRATQFVVKTIQPDSPASISGLRIGDQLQAAGGRPIGNLREYVEVIQYIENNPDSPIPFEILRGDELVDIVVTPDNRDGKGKIGVGFNASNLHKERLGPINAFGKGTSLTAFFVKLTFESVGEVILGKRSAKDSFAGPIGIASMSGSAASQGIVALLGLTALISISVGLANLVLPVPILDGGKIYILFAEMIRRKDFSIEVQQRLAIAGLILIAALFAVVIYIDFTKIISS